MKKPLIITAVVIVVLVVIVMALPLFIDANQFKPTLETDLSKALGRQVAVGSASVGESDVEGHSVEAGLRGEDASVAVADERDGGDGRGDVDTRRRAWARVRRRVAARPARAVRGLRARRQPAAAGTLRPRFP